MMRRIVTISLAAAVAAAPVLVFPGPAAAKSCITQRLKDDGDLGGISGKIFFAYGSHPTDGRQVVGSFTARGETLRTDVRLKKYEYLQLLKKDGTIIEQIDPGQKYRDLDLPENIDVYLQFLGGLHTCKRTKLRT
ncbi:hypothetical protein ACIBEJ_31945 [Nonomuraea sp. NPDC050790]|uniref:hypothetical protein n=1 Tax=Nonomuraea sp. NPDC050790 TaxID=3364371 RepID=UPI00379A2615